MSESNIVRDTLRDLVLANRILAREGVIDDFGHVSVRHPHDAGRYFLSRSKSPELVVLEDIMEFEIDGTPLDQRGRLIYSERAIHSAIYQARPDVSCVAHHHPPSVLPFTVTDTPLRPVYHMAAVIGAELPLWDSQSEFGDTEMLVNTPQMGASLATALGPNRCVLLRGHGAVVVGETIHNAVFSSIYLEENARILLQSLPLGAPTYLTPGEVERTGRLLRSELSVKRSWEYYVARAGFRGL